MSTKNLMVASAALSLMAMSNAHAMEFKDDQTESKKDPTDDVISTAEIKTILDKLGKDNADFQKKYDEELAEVKAGRSGAEQKATQEKMSAQMDKLEAQLKSVRLEQKRAPVSDLTGEPLSEEKQAHSDAFMSFMRKGTEDFKNGSLAELQMKALATTTDPEGGYTAPEQFDREILKIQEERNPFREISGQQTISTSQLKKLRQLGDAGGGWVGETQARPNTGTPTFAQMLFNVMEMYANPNATQTFIDDSFVNVEQWLAGEVEETFTDLENAAFMNGDGVLKPSGFLNSAVYSQNEYDADTAHTFGQMDFVKTGSATGLAVDGSDPGAELDMLIDLETSLKSTYLPNARYVMNRRTLGAARKIRDADGHSYFQPSNAPGVGPTLMGYPITSLDLMPNIGAGNTPIAFGDFRRGYLIIDRIGIRILRDPYTNKPYVSFYTTKRVGGGVYDSNAIKLLKTAV